MDKQTKRIYEYMLTHYGITAKQAMDDLGVFRLGARIWDLKQQGVPVKSGWITVKNRYDEDTRVKIYWIKGCPDNKKEVEVWQHFMN